MTDEQEWEEYKPYYRRGNVRKRGFEKISFEQWGEDILSSNLNAYYDYVSIPKRATGKSAGYDFYSPMKFNLQPGSEIKIPTGVKAYMMDDEVLKIYPRSSLGFKYYCKLANTVGIIDADYYDNPDNEGHIWIKIKNTGNKMMGVRKGEAICQAIFQKYLLADGDSFDGEERTGGIGSTG